MRDEIQPMKGQGGVEFTSVEKCSRAAITHLDACQVAEHFEGGAMMCRPVRSASCLYLRALQGIGHHAMT